MSTPSGWDDDENEQWREDLSAYPPGPPQPGPQSNDNNTLSIIGMVLGGVAVLFCPILIGVAGVVCAIVGKTKGERLGDLALIVSIGGTLLGFVLGYLISQSQLSPFA